LTKAITRSSAETRPPVSAISMENIIVFFIVLSFLTLYLY
jgi:hypothetical protein